MTISLVNTNAKFGTLPVFSTALSTIPGAILFLRFGWAVGQVGFLGAIGIIILGHVVTIPTAFAIAEIATNQRLQGGGAYYIISRSFGLNIGGATGIALYLSQAISVAFYNSIRRGLRAPFKLDKSKIWIPDNRQEMDLCPGREIKELTCNEYDQNICEFTMITLKIINFNEKSIIWKE
jgi:hypothetical protein